jgi:putative NADPH-quinone reductase
MKVLTVFAHPSPQSFCRAVLDRFDAGLRDAGHTNEIVDLYAIGFDPILRPRDTPSWLTETIPDDMLERMRLRESLLGEAGGPLKRFALKRLVGDRDARGIIRLLRERYRPKDVLAQQQKVARAEALAFVAPVHFLSFPADQNSLVLVTQTRGVCAEGRDLPDAAREASLGRVRPKLMTAATAILGLLPLLVLRLHGTEIERPLAIVMIGGLVTSTLFTLLVLPALYLMVKGATSRRSPEGSV